MKIRNHNRIIIIGNGGSGKSYLAKNLSAITGLPLVHLDNEFWQPGWVKTPKEEWIDKQKNMIKEETWIIDGNYNSTMELRYEAADLVIFLDINRLVCIISALKRHGKKRSDLPEYLEEKLDSEFIGFCKLIWDFHRAGKRSILALHGRYPDIPFMVIKRRKEVNKLLKTWKNDSYS